MAQTYKEKQVRTVNVRINRIGVSASGAAGTLGKKIEKTAAASTAAMAFGTFPSSPNAALSAANTIGQAGSAVVTGADVSIALAPAVATLSGEAGNLPIGSENAGTGGSGATTRLGPAGYPIAAIAGGPSVPITRFSLAAAITSGAAGTNDGFIIEFDGSAANAVGATALPIWTASINASGVRAAGTVSAFAGNSVGYLPIAIDSTAAINELSPLLRYRLVAATTSRAVGDFAISIGAEVVLESAVSAGFANEVLPFVGRFTALESIFATGAATDMAAQNAIVLSSVASTSVSDEIRFEGDEIFSLEAAAAAGVVGDFTCAIVIPSEIVICAMNAAMTTNNLIAGLIPNDLNGEIGIGNLVAAAATGAMQTEMQTGSMQTSIRCH